MISARKKNKIAKNVSFLSKRRLATCQTHGLLSTNKHYFG